MLTVTPDSVPLEDFEPVQAPEAVHEVAFVEVQDNWRVEPTKVSAKLEA